MTIKNDKDLNKFLKSVFPDLIVRLCVHRGVEILFPILNEGNKFSFFFRHKKENYITFYSERLLTEEEIALDLDPKQFRIKIINAIKETINNLNRNLDSLLHEANKEDVYLQLLNSVENIKNQDLVKKINFLDKEMLNYEIANLIFQIAKKKNFSTVLQKIIKDKDNKINKDVVREARQLLLKNSLLFTVESVNNMEKWGLDTEKLEIIHPRFGNKLTKIGKMTLYASAITGPLAKQYPKLIYLRELELILDSSYSNIDLKTIFLDFKIPCKITIKISTKISHFNAHEDKMKALKIVDQVVELSKELKFKLVIMKPPAILKNQFEYRLKGLDPQCELEII